MALTHSLTLAGNLTAEPELRTAQSGKPFVRVSIAVNPREFDRDTKEWKDGEPVFWRATAFGDLAEHIAHSLRKGQRVIIHGTVKADSWIDKDSNVKRTEKVIQIEDLGLSLLYTNATATKGAPSQQAQPQQARPAPAQPAYNNDETPF